MEDSNSFRFLLPFAIGLGCGLMPQPFTFATAGVFLYLLIRLNCVSNYRMKILRSPNGLYHHEKLPSFDVMVNQFWVWPMSRFMPKDDELAQRRSRKKG